MAFAAGIDKALAMAIAKRAVTVQSMSRLCGTYRKPRIGGRYQEFYGRCAASCAL